MLAWYISVCVCVYRMGVGGEKVMTEKQYHVATKKDKWL